MPLRRAQGRLRVDTNPFASRRKLQPYDFDHGPSLNEDMVSTHQARDPHFGFGREIATLILPASRTFRCERLQYHHPQRIQNIIKTATATAKPMT